MKYLNKFAPAPCVALLVGFHLAVFFILRLVLLYFVYPDIVDTASIPEGLYVGLKFDARYAVILTSVLWLALFIPALERRICTPEKSLLRRGLCIFQTVVMVLTMFVYIFDFGVFFYLRQRLDLSLGEHLQDPLVSALMIWESYPVIPLLIAFVLLMFFYYKALNVILRSFKTSEKNPLHFSAPSLKAKSCAYVISLRFAIFFVLFVMGYAQINTNLFPLRWSNAYISTDANISLIAINPLQNIYDSRNVNKVLPPDMEAVRDAYPRMAEWLGVDNPDIETLNFTRIHEADPNITSRPNIVILMMESLTTSTLSANHGWGAMDNPNELPEYLDIDTTPFLAELIEKSRYYPNFYAPTRTTARGIFTTVTGIPDVNSYGGTSSRNPKMVDHHVIFNEFDGYTKYYMLGGNANWANIRGVFQNNISDLNILEEFYWESPNVDVWGISDLSLFREAIDVFNDTEKPFIAFVQSAGFHKPYTIPKDNDGFEMLPDPPEEVVVDYWGLANVDEYHSLRFADHALRRFFENAAKEAWFDNTLFVILGDHGLAKSSGNMSPAHNAGLLQAWNIPLIFYGPGIEVGIDETPFTQLDIFPTLAGYANIDYKNTAIGRDMFDSEVLGKDKMAYISPSEHRHMLVQDEYVYIANTGGSQDVMYKLTSKELQNLMDDEPERAARMHQNVWDIYHTAKYLLPNNKK